MESQTPGSPARVVNITSETGGIICAPVIDRTTIQGSLTVIHKIYQAPEVSNSGSRTVPDGGSPGAASEELVLFKNSHRSKLQNEFKHFKEVTSHQGTSIPLNEIYTELYITKGGSGEANHEHEVRKIETTFRKDTQEETLIKCNDIFQPLSGQDKVIRTVLTRGVAGIGKTVSVQKFILDWAEGKANQEIALIFPLPFRELNLIYRELSLMDLLSFFFSQNNALPSVDSNLYKLLLIFDGLDECRLPLDFQNNESLSDVTKSASIDVLLTNLICGNLLPSALLWITTRPAAASLIPPQYVDQITEVRGFTDPQKEEYFRKRISDQSLAERIISHIKASRSLYIMCHMPVFCWISVVVLKRMLGEAESGNIPKTLTQMFTYFLIFQITHKAHSYYATCDTDLQQTRNTILALGKLAFEQLEKGNLIFYEDDLRACGIDVREALVYSGVCTEIFREDFLLHLGRVFSFVHLSIQEFLAALYAFISFISDNRNVLLQQGKGIFGFFTKTTISHFLSGAVDKALQSKNGHLDLFLRFLLGLSLESNQTILKGLLPDTESNSCGKEDTVQYIKEKIRENPCPEKFINLFHCLNELNDHSLVQEVQRYLERGCGGRLSGANLSPAQWSALVFVLLNSEAELDEFNLSEYDSSEECLLKLMPVLKASKKVTLCECNLTEKSCAFLASALTSDSASLRELNLSKNELNDSKVKMLSAGLKSLLCKLQILRLCYCSVTEEGCGLLVKALKSNPSHLRELDLSYNKIGRSGVKELSFLLKDPHCKLEILLLEGCSLSEEDCAPLMSSSVINPHLRELNLNDNKPGDSGAKELSGLFKDPHCKLEKLWLCNCNLTEESGEALAAALHSRSSSLRKLNLSGNKLQDSGVKLLAAGLEKPNCKLEMLGLEDCSITDKGCTALVTAVTSNPSHLRELNLSSNVPGESGVKALSELLEDPHCRMEKIQLSDCSLTGTSCAVLASALRSNSSSLKELDLSYNSLQDTGVNLLSAGIMNQHCKLVTIRLEHCNITERGCVALVEALKSNPFSHLREINLNRNEPGKAGVELLSDLLVDPNCKLEKLLMLGLGTFREEGCVSQASAQKQLRNPDPNYKKPRDSGAKGGPQLLEDLHCNLENRQLWDLSQSKELNLNFKKVEDSGLKLLSSHLLDPNCKVEKLLLRWCNLTKDSCATLASVLGSNSHLRELNLNSNKLQDSGVKLLSVGLENPHCKLKILSLCGCGLTEASCTTLSSALNLKSSRLRELNLSSNKLQDLGVKKLSAGLKNPHCKLEILGLKYCSITEEGCAALVKALKTNPSSRLRELNLSFNKPGTSGLVILSELLEDPKCKLATVDF